MATFTHKGVDIILDETTGLFRFGFAGKRYKKKSLEAAKKVIDTSPTFTPFKALLNYIGRVDPTEVTVIGIAKTRASRWTSQYQFEVQGGHTHTRLLADTVENRQLLKDYAAMEERHTAMRSQLSDELQQLRDKFQFIDIKPFMEKHHNAKG